MTDEQEAKWIDQWKDWIPKGSVVEPNEDQLCAFCGAGLLKDEPCIGYWILGFQQEMHFGHYVFACFEGACRAN